MDTHVQTGETLARFPKYSQTTRSAQPVKAMQSRGTARRRWTTYLVVFLGCVFSFSDVSDFLSWKLSISENIVLYNCALKHPKTIHLSTPLCKGHNCSTVQHNFILTGMSTHHSANQPLSQPFNQPAGKPLSHNLCARRAICSLCLELYARRAICSLCLELRAIYS